MNWFGQFSKFSPLECLKLMFGASYWLEIDTTNRRMVKAKVSFKPPDWVHPTAIGKTYEVHND